MATVKVVLRKKVNKDGTFPLALRITKDRKTSFIHLGYNLKEYDWNADEQLVKQTHPNSKRLNNLILKKRAEASDKSIEAETHSDIVSAKVIRRKLKPKAEATFLGQAKLYLQRLKEVGNYNSYSAEKSRIKIFMQFVNGMDITKGKPTGKKDEEILGLTDIAFHEITVGLLEKFEVALISKRKAGARTVMNYFMVIRSIFSQALKEGVIDGKHYPFGSGKISIKFPESTKIGKTKSDVEKLETVELPDPSHDHARNLWLVSFYFAGMRVSDVLRLRWSDFVDMRLHYTMGKNNKPGSVAVLYKAFTIIGKYEHLKRTSDDLVFPDLREVDFKNEFEVKKRITHVVNWTNKKLQRYVAPAAGIEGNISMHLSRHTFATEAGDKVPIKILQQLYRHSDARTTIAYQSAFIHKDADDALAAVIG